MNFSVTTCAGGDTIQGLLPYLMALDQYQLEEFKLCLEPRQLMDFWSAPQGHFPCIPWANLRAADPLNLSFLLDEHFPKGQAWKVVLGIFQTMNLTSLCEKVTAKMKENVQTQELQDPTQEDVEMLEAAAGNMQTQGCQDPNQEELEELEEETGNVQAQECQDPNQEEPEMLEEADHRRKYREKMKAELLETWDNISWPKDHIYIRNTSKDEHEELERLLDPNRTRAQAQTIVLVGSPGVGKTTLAMQAMLHWASGVLFQQRFSYVFYLSCHKIRHMKETTFAELISLDWPDFDAPIEEFMSQPEKLLFIIDGFEEILISESHSESLDDGSPCTDWYQQLPVTKILHSLLKKELVPLATLLITIKTWFVTDLKASLVNPCFVQITGFTGEDLWVYFMRHFDDSSEVEKILQQMRKNETLFHSCSAPMVCWTVCSCLKQPKVRYYDLQSITQTTTSLYAYFFSNLFSTAEVDLADDSWPGQWKALCSLAIEGLWSMNFTFNKVDTEIEALEVPFIDSLYEFNILQKINDRGGCTTFTHLSFQEFFAAMSFVLEEPREFLSHSTKPQEMKMLLRDVLLNKEDYWTSVVLFFFGLLNKNIARELEDTLHCKISPRVMEELLKWGEELGKAESASLQFHILQLFHCLRESQEEDFAKKMLGHIFEVDLNILGDEELQASSFCLKHCKRLNKLRLSVSSHILERDLEILETSKVDSRMHAWNSICSTLVTNENLHELDLSNSKLHASSVKGLCLALKNPRCKIQKLTCKSVTPEWVLQDLIIVLQGNSKLTHLNFSSNKLGMTVPLILKALRHSGCNLKYLCLEKCNLSAATCQHLALFLTSIQHVTRLCLGFNRLQDDGIKLLCAALTHPKCALERLELWFCQLGAPACKHLSDALLQNRSLAHLNLSKNSLRDKGVKFLCEALGRPDCNLQSLNLSGCSFTREGCRELANALRHNHNVKILDLGENDLKDDGVKLLCEALKPSPRALHTLGLAKCSLTTACCQHLFSVLSSRKSLVNLNLLGNELDPDGVKMLCFRKTCTM
ncbi:NACHT, LRR and PYD domains-containing protein 13 isoform X2 [Symphalangus syndactylus]|uniref:NACHT, LRR and PYD domains-containing protein 13 isoform X2 n=1 Tax=Symphalangus syndactylus TaxID=9590 RepID=UPI0024415AD4|nr:NACHT, LRR and PYD domains-containing protein 13 isoform X2 [Symphalangus syndactylus]